MSGENLSQIEQQIRACGFCAVVEVTNGLSKMTVKKKANQALRARGYFQGNAQEYAHVQAGVIFFRNREAESLRSSRLDFLLQIPHYEPERSQEALRRTLHRLTTEREKQLAQYFLDAVLKGEDLEALLYATHLDAPDWFAFRRQHSSIMGNFDPQEYNSEISGIKGRVLEEYAQLLCQDEMPEAHVYGPQKYYHSAEIDLVIVGTREHIAPAVSQPKQLIPHHTDDAA